jgi:hypothetical protein
MTTKGSEMSASGQRRRLSEAQWREVMQRFDGARATVEDFCTGEGVSTTSFYRWRALLAQARPARHRPAVSARRDLAPVRAAVAAPGFVDLGALGERGAVLELCLDLGGGVVLQLSRRG